MALAQQYTGKNRPPTSHQQSNRRFSSRVVSVVNFNPIAFGLSFSCIFSSMLLSWGIISCVKSSGLMIRRNWSRKSREIGVNVTEKSPSLFEKIIMQIINIQPHCVYIAHGDDVRVQHINHRDTTTTATMMIIFLCFSCMHRK